MVGYLGGLLMVAGWGPSGYLNDVLWSADGLSWQQSTTAAFSAVRMGQGCAVFLGKVFAVGGYNGNILNQVWTPPV